MTDSVRTAQVLKFALLGLLAPGPRHGYELKAAFEDLAGGTWPLNEGQVYTTLGRLERDGLVESRVVRQDLLPDRRVFHLTEAGWAELYRWLAEPAPDAPPLKDELFLKVLVHSVVDGGDPIALLWRQRQRSLETLARLNALRTDPDLRPATALLVEGAAYHVEAHLRWLDVCEQRLPQLKSGTS